MKEIALILAIAIYSVTCFRNIPSVPIVGDRTAFDLTKFASQKSFRGSTNLAAGGQVPLVPYYPNKASSSAN